MPTRPTLKKLILFSSLFPVLGICFTGSIDADVVRYKNEAQYLARLAELGYTSVVEGFESTAWDAIRSPTFNDRNQAPSLSTQGLTWETAAKDLWGDFGSSVHGITTNHNWARGDADGWGLYEAHNDAFGYPTTIRVTSETPMYAIGGWFDTNPDFVGVGYLFEDRTTANDPGYLIPGFGAMYPGDNKGAGHMFNGLIDEDGFTSVVLTGTLEINDDNQLEGGAIMGVDDFTFGFAQSVPEPSGSVLLSIVVFGLFGRRRRTDIETGPDSIESMAIES